MLLAGVIGFVCGLILPLAGSRFGKVLPADPGLVFLRLWHRPRFPDVPDMARALRLRQKWRKLLLFSFLWGLALAGLFLASRFFIGGAAQYWVDVFCFIVCLSIIVDQQYFLLPDFLTLPLLLTGFASAIYGGLLPIEYSLFGVLFGYGVSVISVVVMGIFRRLEFGAGDVKMITALGAWLGAPGLNFTLLLSFFLFAARLFFHSRRHGAFGPALGVSALFVLFVIYAK